MEDDDEQREEEEDAGYGEGGEYKVANSGVNADGKEGGRRKK